MRIRNKTRRARFAAVCALSLACAASLAAARQSSAETAKKSSKESASGTTTKTESTSQAGAGKSSGKIHRASSRRRKSWRKRGQQKIDGERAQAIQEALIREHYLGGEATGTWNQASEDAMRRYQADNGWQTKTVPDSRALIKLGLGPSKDHLLNPDSAMTTVPDLPRAASVPTNSHSATPTADPPAPSATSPQTDSTKPQ